MTAVTATTITSDTYVNSLLYQYKWTSPALTYSFPTSLPADTVANATFYALSADQQNATKYALGVYSQVSGLTFTELSGSSTNDATIRFMGEPGEATAYAYYPTTSPLGGDAFIGDSSHMQNPALGTYARTVLMHELGHAMGLRHPHSGNMPLDKDTIEYSVMSYRSYYNASVTAGYYAESGGFPQSLMMLDIAAIQSMYGANFTTNGGNTVYKWDATTGQAFVDGVAREAPSINRVFETIWDGGGVDTYDFSNYTTNLSVNLTPGSWTTTAYNQLAVTNFLNGTRAAGNIANAQLYNGDTRSLIENVNGGSGNDTIIGNQANNVLNGGTGNDTLDGGLGNDTLNGGVGNDTMNGGAGNDTMNGGAGDDIYVIDSTLDVIVEGVNSGNDSVQTTLTTFKLTNANLENLTYTGTGNFVGNGNGANNIMIGGVGNDSLYGGAGSDTLAGGLGNDNLYGNAGVDTINGGVGADNLYGGTEDDTLNGEADNDILYGEDGVDNLYGGTGNDTLWGGNGNDALNGGDGNDWLDGGVGNDTMDGGIGDDTYVVDSVSDFVYEAANAGLDSIKTMLSSYTLGSNFESLTFAGTNAYSGLVSLLAQGNELNNSIRAGAGNDTINGFAGNDNLYAYAGNDTLDGGIGSDMLDGGLGNDTLTGGTGNDRFVVYFGTSGGYTDTITDFMQGEDKLNIATSQFATFATLLGATSQDGADTIITLGGDRFVIQNFTAANLTEADVNLV